MNFELSQDQLKGKQEILSFLDDPKSQTLVLKGYAGTGKTTLIQEVVKELDGRATVAFTSPTNKATKVLREMAYEAGVDVDHVATIYSLLGLVLKPDGGVKLVRRGGAGSKANDFSLVVIDECFTPDMEVMTDKGFIRFDNLNKTELIAQFDSKDSSITYVRPVRYIEKEYVGNVYNFVTDKVINVSVTENHEMLVKRGSNWHKIKAKELAYTYNNTMKVAGRGVGSSKSLSLDDKLAIAYQADGYCRGPYALGIRHKNMTKARFGFTPKDGHCSLRFAFKKEAKCSRFVSDFGRGAYLFDRGKDTKQGHSIFHLRNVPSSIVSKNFADVFDITTFSQAKAREFINYLKLWDGFIVSKSGVGYSNTNKSSIDFVQQVAVLAGYRSSIIVCPDNRSETYNTCYKVHISTDKDYITTQGLKRVRNIVEHYSGKVYCVTVPAGNIIVRRGGRTLVAGNCSMLSTSVMEYLQHDLHATDTKFIFMGDPLQLPPVGEENSSSFDMADRSVELTKVVRQAAGNPIIQLTEDIRRALTDDMYGLELKSAKDSEGHGVYVLPKAKWEAWMRAGFKSDAYRKDGDAFRAIAWRNVAVDYLNNMVREAMYGEESSQPFLKGERVLTASPIQDEFREEVLASTDSEGTIRAVSEGIHPWIERMGLGELNTYHLKIWFDEVGMVDAYVLHPDSERQHSRTLNNLSSEARADGKLWDTFWTFKDSFHDIRPAHAITSHRSQGSTYDNAFVDVQDIFKNRNKSERLKSLYVACSRARSNLMLLV